jgi:hypothetical protein
MQHEMLKTYRQKIYIMSVANVNKIIQQCGSFGRRRNELVREGKRKELE